MAQNNFLDVVCDRIKFDKNKIESNEIEHIEVDSFNLQDFWSQFGAAVQAVSNQVTKISFVCGKEPFPSSDEVGGLMGDLLQCYSVMRDLFLVLPEEVGQELYKNVTSAFTDILGTLISVISSLNDLTEQGAKERLVLTGAFWEACNAVEALPKNNLDVALLAIDTEANLAKDALNELKTTIDEDRENTRQLGEVENSELWTNPERDLAIQSVGLVKVTLVCLQRLQRAVADCGSSATPEHIAELDITVAAVRTVSPALDDFVSELYHPIDVPTALENAGKLAAVLCGLVSTVKDCHYKLSSDIAKKLLLFIRHNHQKLLPQPPGCEPDPSLLLEHLSLNSHQPSTG